MFAAALLMLALEAQTHARAKSAGPDYAALSLYKGTWQVNRANRAPGSKPDLLVNQCALVGRYFACQQTINGETGRLQIFIPTDQPEHFYTQVIMPEGRATGRDDLEIAGDRQTYTSKRLDRGNNTFYKTTNTFQGKNKIHFEQADSTDGKQWTVRSSGDEVRVR